MNHTSAQGKPLTKHMQGECASCEFNHSRVVGMLLYLASHTFPEIMLSTVLQDICSAKICCTNVLKPDDCYLKGKVNND